MSDHQQVSAELSQHGFNSRVIGGTADIFNNGHIGICKDMVFGLCVWDGKVWFPIAQLDEHDKKVVRAAINKGTFPFPWEEELSKLGC